MLTDAGRDPHPDLDEDDEDEAGEPQYLVMPRRSVRIMQAASARRQISSKRIPGEPDYVTADIANRAARAMFAFSRRNGIFA